MDEALTAKYRLPRSRRLIKSSAFGAVLSARGRNTVWKSSLWLTASALLKPECEEKTGVRVGFTVGKHNAHRGVDRVLIKRILRESARHAVPVLVSEGIQADIVLRLKRRIPKLGHEMPLEAFRKELREDCDRLTEALIRQIERRSAVSPDENAAH